MVVEFFEHPAYSGFTRDVHEPLPPFYDVPVPPGRMGIHLPEPQTSKSLIRVRRFRLEIFNKIPRYVWVGWATR